MEGSCPAGGNAKRCGHCGNGLGPLKNAKIERPHSPSSLLLSRHPAEEKTGLHPSADEWMTSRGLECADEGILFSFREEEVPPQLPTWASRGNIMLSHARQ